MTSDKIKIATIIYGAVLVVCSDVSAEILVFDNINVVPMDQEQILENYRVIVDGNVIAAVEPASSELKVKADRVIDCKDRFMVPGFAETHYHQNGTNPQE